MNHSNYELWNSIRGIVFKLSRLWLSYILLVDKYEKYFHINVII